MSRKELHTRQAVLLSIIVVLIAALVTSCSTISIPEPAPVERVSGCDSCLQIQQVNFGDSITEIWYTIDTVFQATPADTVQTLYYGWFDCSMDTVIYSPDSIVRNRMWCQ